MSHASSAALALAPAPSGATREPADTAKPHHDADALLELARTSGMLVLLDAEIGQQRYHSVAGSVASLVRFAMAISESVRRERAPC
ncbi:hypothetical protein [Paraburkholderia phosphatilytica]|uniref:hypothetical protein n=1 Tax=Paraburkholderia phosphatilytica TaxID=2282883 RepID=UPI000E474B5B|nr:hypothetical protein [Paraburkholderia phosphatilytica]